MYKYLFHCETIRSSLSEATVYRYHLYTEIYVY